MAEIRRNACLAFIDVELSSALVEDVYTFAFIYTIKVPKMYVLKWKAWPQEQSWV